MFSGEEMKKRLMDIHTELGFAPELGEAETDETNLAMYAGGADAVLGGVYRMVGRLISDIQDEIDKDNEKAEADRKWWDEYRAKEAAKSQDETESKNDSEEVPDAE